MNSKIRTDTFKSFIILFVLGICVFVLSLLSDPLWFDMLVKIRESINTSDSGPLILSSAAHSTLFAIKNTLAFIMTATFLLAIPHYRALNLFLRFILHVALFGLFVFLISLFFGFSNEQLSGIVAALLTITIVPLSKNVKQYLLRLSVVSIQVFLAIQWLNVMPLFSKYGFGITDIPNSIKMASLYLQSDFVLDFVGFAFLIPLTFSALVSSFLFLSFDYNIMITEENYLKEKALENIKSKAMENRIHQEINALTHDLKTPLVTIRGLNSLLSLSNDSGKIKEYTDRIEGAVSKMSEMISSFLYDHSRQTVSVAEIVDCIRAQIPIEETDFTFNVHLQPDLPPIHVNKVRMIRALINLIENAIVVPTNQKIKDIQIQVTHADSGIIFKISDNGLGISPNNLKFIWNAGFSTNNTSGLGLSFAKKVIEDNDGTIHIDSTLDIGTVVIVHLPVKMER